MLGAEDILTDTDTLTILVFPHIFLFQLSCLGVLFRDIHMQNTHTRTHAHTGGLTMNQCSTRHCPQSQRLKTSHIYFLLMPLPASIVKWLFVIIPLRPKLKGNSNQKAACHCGRKKREQSRGPYTGDGMPWPQSDMHHFRLQLTGQN